MKGIFTIPLKIAATTGAATGITFIYVTAPSHSVLEIQTSIVGPDANDTSEQIVLAWNHISTLGTPAGGTALTNANVFATEGAADPTFTGKINPSSEPTTYDRDTGGVALGQFGLEPVPSVGGYRRYDIENRVIVAPGESMGLRLLGTITSMSFQGHVDIREIGGTRN
jgi:hypothetical protein